jgi:hypothetical protein
MKVVYNFIYADPDGKPQEFQMPVNVTEETDANLMYDLCLSYLKIGHVGGTPLHAVSTSKQYPNYCFTSTACDDECQACRSKKLSGAQPYQPQSLDGKKIYIYEGKFAKVGQFSNRIIQKSYLLPAPALLTDNLIQDFKKAMNAEPDGMGWELLGVTLVHELNPQGMTDKEIEKYVKTPEGNLFTPEEKASEEKMIWARTSDENEDRTAWIPALVRGKQVLSAIGELDNPDNPEDTRDFDDCPIPGYRVVKESDPTSDLCMARIAVLVTPVNSGDTKRKSFMYINEFPIQKGLTDKEAERYLMKMTQNFMFGSYDMEPIYWEYLSYLNGAENHQPKEYMKELNSDDMEVPHFLVTYTVTENEKEQRIREHSCVVIASAPVTSPIMMIPSAADVHQRLQKYIKGKVTIENIKYFEDVVSSLAVVL